MLNEIAFVKSTDAAAQSGEEEATSELIDSLEVCFHSCLFRFEPVIICSLALHFRPQSTNTRTSWPHCSASSTICR